MPEEDRVLRHIRHAEQWLRWARGDCRRGDVHSAVLRLLLAEAEIRHAREAGISLASDRITTERPRSLPLAMLGAAAALVIGATTYVVVRAEFPEPAVTQSVQPIGSHGEQPIGSQDVHLIESQGASPAGLQGTHPARPQATKIEQAPFGVVQLDTGRLLTLVPSPSEAESERSSAPWGLRPLPGEASDGPASRFGYIEPAPLDQPSSLTVPADSEHLSSSF